MYQTVFFVADNSKRLLSVKYSPTILGLVRLVSKYTHAILAAKVICSILNMAPYFLNFSITNIQSLHIHKRKVMYLPNFCCCNTEFAHCGTNKGISYPILNIVAKF